MSSLSDPSPPTIRLAGIRFHALTESESIAHVIRQLDAGVGGWVVTPNLDHLQRLCRNPALRRLYSRASLVVADGMPLIWASCLQRTPLPERVAGSSLVWTLTAAGAANNRSVFLLGGAPGTAARAAEVLRSRHPDLRIAGVCCPEIGFEKDPRALASLVAQLRSADPDIIYVALGSPKQERLIARFKHQFPRAWWLGIGIGFSIVAGDVARAPRWMQRTGLDRTYRLCQEPRRLLRRYLVDGVPFALWLLSQSLQQRRRATTVAGETPGSPATAEFSTSASIPELVGR